MFEVELARIGDALAALVAALDPDRLDGAIATVLFAGLDRIERLAWAGKTLLAATVADQQAGPGGGGRTGNEGLARSSGTGTGTARDQVAACRALPTLPLLAAALRAGSLSAAQATLITPACTADPSAQHRLVELAGQVSLAELRAECARVRAAADPDPEATNRRIHTGRRLRRYTDPDGAWNLCARGTPQAGAAFNAVLDPLVDAAIRAARGSDDHEPFEAHAFDALMNLADLAAHHQSGEAPGHVVDGPAAGADRAGDSPARPPTQPSESPSTPEAGLPDAPSVPRAHPPAAARSAPAGPATDSAHGNPAVAASGSAHGEPAARASGSAQAEPAEGQDAGPAAGARLGVQPRSRPEAGPASPVRDLDPAGVAGSGGRPPIQPDTDEGVAPTSTTPADPPVRRPESGRRGRMRRRSDPRYLALLRVDLTALHRGRVAGDELCEIAGVGPIPVTVARDLLGQAVLKLVITRGVDVAHVTHLGRGPTAAQRVALAWTSPQCSVLGCSRTHVQIDHRLDWASTRHTRLGELDPLCPYHHDLKTRHGWALVPGTGRRAFVPPHDPHHPRRRPGDSAGPVPGQPSPFRDGAGPLPGQLSTSTPALDRAEAATAWSDRPGQSGPPGPPGHATPAPAPANRLAATTPTARPRRAPSVSRRRHATAPLFEEPDS